METYRVLAEDQSFQPIGDVYAGKSIFVTGGTGFLGKVFVEKILYRCPKLAKVYILIRNTEKTSAHDKLKNMLDSTLFKRLRDDRPEYLDKIIPIIGDITKPRLGIKADDEKLLLDSVSIVYHFAASVRFDESLHVAFNTNVEGTRRVLDLCTKIKKLQVFVYVSTAFCNYNRKVVDEVVYPPCISLEDVEKLMQHKEFTEEETKQILNGLPNTYILAKGIAESLVATYHKERGVPSIIVRPSIVASCMDEPLRGWIDNMLGATALIVTISKGVARAVRGHGDNIIDLIPADYVANVIAVSAARYKGSQHVEVYNSCSSAVNPLTLNKLEKFVAEDSTTYKLYELPRPGVIFVKSRLILCQLIFLLERFPAYLTDCVLRIKGKERKFMKIMSKVARIRDAVEPFTSRTWFMGARNTSALSETLSSSDRLVFPCDAATFKWEEYIPIYLSGVREYLQSKKI